MESLEGLHFDNTLGATLLGTVAACVLFGVTSVQTFIYFRNQYQDNIYFKSTIAFLWVLDSFHLALTVHGLYFYLVTNFLNPIPVLSPTWSLLTQVYVTCISDLIVRCIFAHRVWMLSNRKHILAIVIVGVSLFTVASGFAFGTRGFIDGTFAKLIEEAWMLYAALGSDVLADALIAVSLCYLLQRSRTGFARTDSLVNVLMLYSINTGLLTSVCAAACFITFSIWPHTFIFIGIYLALGKLYLNSLLAVLNSRATIRHNQSSIGGHTPSHGSSAPQSFPMKLTTGLAVSEPGLSDTKGRSLITDPKYRDNFDV